MKKYNIGILAIQEMRWKGEGIIKSGDFTICYSGGSKSMYGTGFLINNCFKELLLDFNAFNDRISVLRIKGKIFNTTLINGYAPTEDQEAEKKDTFYDDLEGGYSKAPKNDVKIILGDFNAKIGREEVYWNIAGKNRLHEFNNDNGN